MKITDFCLHCGHYHEIEKTTKKFACTLTKSEWDCKCNEKDFVGRNFKGSFG